MDKDIPNLKETSIRGFSWRFMQNISTQIIGLVIQIVLARLLMPEDYGLVALTSVINIILNTIVSTGFSSSLVQKKDITELDKSSMFFFSLFLGGFLYCFVFCVAPVISKFYNQDLLVPILRVQAVSILTTSVCSVHNAVIQRELDFKKSFVAGFVGVVIQGSVGIIMAIKGFGVWALVVSSLLSGFANCCVLLILCKWRPTLEFSWASIRGLFSFSSKILTGNVLNTVYNCLQTLIIGKVYDPVMIGYYNKGFSFPVSMMNSVDGAMNAVLFSSLSRLQDEKAHFVVFLRKSIKVSLTIVTPLLFGMAAVADPMIELLLTDKWKGAVPFVIIQCIACLSWPLSAKTHAINAIGKSGTNLAVNILVKIVSLALVLFSIPYGVYVMCLSSLVGTLISVLVYSVIVSKSFCYSISLQLKDVLPIYGIGFIMFVCVYSLSFVLRMNLLVKLLVLFSVGAVIYIGLSFALRMEGFFFLLFYAREVVHRNRN